MAEYFEGEGGMSARRRVLVIEDEHITAMELSMTLEDLGFEICAVARTEDEAVWAAEANRPDLITADVRLLRGDGITAVNRITERRPTPVVYISSSDRELTERAPAAIRVDKPFDTRAVASAVARALSEPGGSHGGPA